MTTMAAAKIGRYNGIASRQPISLEARAAGVCARHLEVDSVADFVNGHFGSASAPAGLRFRRR
jgi:hypothetical protein